VQHLKVVTGLKLKYVIKPYDDVIMQTVYIIHSVHVPSTRDVLSLSLCLLSTLSLSRIYDLAMPLKTVHYQRLETEDSDGEEDEAPPTHVELHSSHNVKGEGGWFVINHDQLMD